MNNTATITLATGVLFGTATIYAYKQGVTFDSILDKFENNKERFVELVNTLVELGQMMLEKILKLITEIVKQVQTNCNVLSNKI